MHTLYELFSSNGNACGVSYTAMITHWETAVIRNKTHVKRSQFLDPASHARISVCGGPYSGCPHRIKSYILIPGEHLVERSFVERIYTI